MLAILTNQCGIASARTGKRADMVKHRIAMIHRALAGGAVAAGKREADALPFLALACCVKGDCRKPASGMWTALRRLVGPVAVSDSLYVGDAAGRVGDHSDSDLAFAQGVGVEFAVPEQLFRPLPSTADAAQPAGTPTPCAPSLVPLPTPPGPPFDRWQPLLPDERPQLELVLTLGPPGAGKTSYALHCLPTYVRANRDHLGTFPRVVALTRSCLADGRSVVVDNTNGKREHRLRLLQAAAEAGVRTRAVIFHTPVDRAKAANKTRKGKERVPPVAFASYYKYAEPVDESVELYDEVTHREQQQ